MPAVIQLTPVEASEPGIAPAIKHDDDAHRREANDPSGRERGTARPGCRPVEDHDDGHDGDRAQRNGSRGWQQVADGLVQHRVSLPASNFDGRGLRKSPVGLTFAELLIDCEEDRTLRAVLVGMLREADL